jgi:GTP-binding protein
MYVGHKIAIVADEAGTTRDITEYEYTDHENEITYIFSDSGGLDMGSKSDEIAQDIVERTTAAIMESDLLLFLIEYDRITELDENILKILRTKGIKNVVLVANKADNQNKILDSFAVSGFGGFEKFFPVSTSHNHGIDAVKEYVASFLKEK